MKLHFTSALIICLFSTIMMAQTDAPVPATDDVDETLLTLRGVSINVMPASVINLLPRLRFGIEYKPSRFGFLIDVEHGSDFTQGLLGLPNNEKYNFIGIRPEVRFDFIPEFTPLYLGIEVPITEVRRRKDGVYDSADGRRLRVENVQQDRYRIGVIGKLGIRFLAFGNVVVDVYLGLGMANRKVTYTGATSSTTAPEEVLQADQLFSFDLFPEGRRNVPEAAAGFRVGYLFGGY